MATVTSPTSRVGTSLIVPTLPARLHLKVQPVGKLDDVQKYDGHVDTVLDVATSSDGHFLVTASRDMTAILWELRPNRTYKRRYMFPHREWVRGVDLAPDASILATASGRLITLWKTSTGKQRRVITGHRNFTTDVCFHKTEPVVACTDMDGDCSVWSVAATSIGKRRSIMKHLKAALSCAFSPTDPKLLAVSCADHDLYLWRWPKRTLIAALKHSGPATRCFWSPDGKLVGTTTPGYINLYKTPTKEAAKPTIGGRDTDIVAVSTGGYVLAAKWPAQAKHYCRPGFIKDPNYTALAKAVSENLENEFWAKRLLKQTPWLVVCGTAQGKVNVWRFHKRKSKQVLTTFEAVQKLAPVRACITGRGQSLVVVAEDGQTFMHNMVFKAKSKAKS